MYGNLKRQPGAYKETLKSSWKMEQEVLVYYLSTKIFFEIHASYLFIIFFTKHAFSMNLRKTFHRSMLIQ